MPDNPRIPGYTDGPVGSPGLRSNVPLFNAPQFDYEQLQRQMADVWPPRPDDTDPNDNLFEVKIIAVGPGTGFYTVTRESFPGGQLDPTSNLAAAAVAVDAIPAQTMVAFNLAELSGGSALSVGTYVWVTTTSMLTTSLQPVVGILGSGGSTPSGEFQGDVCQDITNNSVGFGPVMFTSPR